MEGIEVIQGDCREIMAGLADGSVDAVVTDPPYFRAIDEDWDRQWETEADYLDWLGAVADEWRRLLKPNGSLYVFASTSMAAKVECLIGTKFNVLNRIIWRKQAAWTREGKTDPGQSRSFYPVTETLIFAEHKGNQEFIRTARLAAGMSAKELTGAIGAHGAINHGGAVSNWEANRNTPGQDQYERMREHCSLPPYEDAIRPFSIPALGPHVDVWDFASVPAKPGRHPCQKPLPLLNHILECSTRGGDLILDPFAGSGSTLVAAAKAGRRAVGIELDERYCEVARRRIAEASTPLFDQLAS